MLRKSYQPAPHLGPSIALVAALLAVVIWLALSASGGRVGIDSPDQPLRAPAGNAG